MFKAAFFQVFQLFNTDFIHRPGSRSKFCLMQAVDSYPLSADGTQDILPRSACGSMWRCAAVADIAEVSGIVPPSCGRKCFCCCPAWGTPSCAMRGVSRRFQPAAGRHDGGLPDGSIAAVEVARDAVDFAAQLRQREPPAILPKVLFSQFFDSGFLAFLRQKLPPADGIGGWGFPQQGHFGIKMPCSCANPPPRAAQVSAPQSRAIPFHRYWVLTDKFSKKLFIICNISFPPVVYRAERQKRRSQKQNCNGGILQ